MVTVVACPDRTPNLYVYDPGNKLKVPAARLKE